MPVSPLERGLPWGGRQKVTGRGHSSGCLGLVLWSCHGTFPLKCISRLSSGSDTLRLAAWVPEVRLCIWRWGVAACTAFDLLWSGRAGFSGRGSLGAGLAASCCRSCLGCVPRPLALLLPPCNLFVSFTLTALWCTPSPGPCLAFQTPDPNPSSVSAANLPRASSLCCQPVCWLPPLTLYPVSPSR